MTCEAIVHLYEEFGEACVEKLRGMLGFAVLDSQQNTLPLARDRVGIKPIYFSVTRNEIVIGSEIETILADPEAGSASRFLSIVVYGSI